MKKTIIAAIALFSMASCSVSVDETIETGYGYIDLGITSETEISVVTKAEETAYDNYDIILKKGETVEWTKKYSEVKNSTIKVEAGNYTLTAVNQAVEAAHPANDKGSVLVSGTSSLAVQTGITSRCDITCAPINSKVSFKYTQKFIDIFPTVAVNAGTTDRKLDLTPAISTAANDSNLDAAYFPAEAVINWTLNVTNTQDVSKSYDGSFTTTADKWHIVTFDISGENGQFDTIIVTVDDTIDSTVEETVPLDPLK